MTEEKKEEKKGKTKVPTPVKRHKQDAKKGLRNRIWKSRILTARNTFNKLPEGEEKKKALSQIYSLVDKAAKIGLYKKNKASRIKSRLS